MPSSCHEPHSKVFVLVTQSHFPNQQAADVCEAKIGHMRRLSMAHRPTLYPCFLVGWSFFVESAKLYCFLLSFADYFIFFFFFFFFFFFVIGTESGNNRPTVGRFHRGLGHLIVGRQTPMKGRASGENRATIVGRQSPDICHLSPAALRTDGRSRATVATYISSRLHYTHHILCQNASVVADGGKKLIVQLLEPYYLYWMRGHPRVVWSVKGRGTIENTYRLLIFFFFFFFFFVCWQ